MGEELPFEERLKLMSEESSRLQAENEKLWEEKKSLLNRLHASEAAVEKLEQLAVFSESASEIAHEINNPVNFVSGSLSIIKRGVNDFIGIMDLYRQLDGFDRQPLYKKLQELEEEVDVELTKKELRDATATIEKGMERIHEIAHNLGLLGKKQLAAPIQINVNQSISDTLMMIREMTAGQIELRAQLGNIPEIMGYRGKLNQVFTNIIKNAVEAIQAKPQLHNECLSVKSELKNDHVVISIKDTGIGMSAETMEKLFDKFYTTKHPGKGIGLGMSVCKAIVDKHKGSISVESEKGKGTELIISLPLKH